MVAGKQRGDVCMSSFTFCEECKHGHVQDYLTGMAEETQRSLPR